MQAQEQIQQLLRPLREYIDEQEKTGDLIRSHVNYRTAVTVLEKFQPLLLNLSFDECLLEMNKYIAETENSKVTDLLQEGIIAATQLYQQAPHRDLAGYFRLGFAFFGIMTAYNLSGGDQRQKIEKPHSHKP